MILTQINTIPRGAERELGAEVFTPGYGNYFIHCYHKGQRRYFEMHGWYVGKSFWSTSVNDDKETAIRQLRQMAEDKILKQQPFEHLKKINKED